MLCIVGLGNPGDEYTNTRHNVGWLVLDRIIERRSFSGKIQSAKHASFIAHGAIGGKEVDVLFPITFMNNTGSAVLKYIKEKGKPELLIAVHDEIDIPFGEVKVSYDRGAGGHNGVKSLIDAYGSQFVRIRVGVGKKNILGILKRPQGDALSKYVLSEFKSGEVKEIPTIVEKVSHALELLCIQGLEAAMQEVNKN